MERVSQSRRYPRVQRGVHPHPVAVVGGGPSLLDRLDELREWPGDIWAINRTADWLQARGIDCAYFSVDPLVIPSSVKRALVCSACHPQVLEGKDVLMFDLSEHGGGIVGGSTTATRAPTLAAFMGYPGVHFFGCDSSFQTFDHIDRHEAYPEELIVKANGRTFHTYPEFLMQAECLTDIIRLAPELFVNKSGGLLQAMMVDDQWEVVAVSDALKASLIEWNGDTGLYDKPYAAETHVAGACGHSPARPGRAGPPA